MRRASEGSSLVEALVVLSLLTVMVTFAGIEWVRWRQLQRLRGAVAELSLRIAAAQALAAASATTHGIAFDAEPPDLHWRLLRDGDGDGIAAADVAAGIDVDLRRGGSLAARYPGVEVGLPAEVPVPGASSRPPDGVALGRSDILSLRPDGRSSSGTVYLCAGATCAALRIYGVTGRRRVLWWSSERGSWSPPA